jgi:hypothetical protein
MKREFGIHSLLEKHNRLLGYVPEGKRTYIKEAGEDITSDLNTPTPDENLEDKPVDDNLGDETFDLDSDTSNDFGDSLPTEPQTDLTTPVETASTEPTEELDVTEFIKKSEELNNRVDQQVKAMTDQVTNLTNKLQSMDSLINKIQQVEDEINSMKPQKPIETLKLRSLDSYPYNQGIDDYWKQKEIEIEKLRDTNRVTGKDKKEYVLTTDDVNNFSDIDIRNSMTPSSNTSQQNNFDRYQSDEMKMGQFNNLS